MEDLKTNSEKYALKAMELPAFEKITIQGLKKEVAEMLNMVGKTNQIFATYTKHDISHVNAMLKHLDWLIPPLTQKEMTPVDWLLITLAIYFHDLGMIVTAEEFDKRMRNEAFSTFLEKLKTDPKSQDYIGRAKKMTPEQQDSFFFQEFIRENHAVRIREWINGRHSRYWSAEVKPITELIADLIKPFPSRFRENLAAVCESHHNNNLNKLELYPLCQRYGNEPLEMANVQYAALILRTVDLIHVTKDRTPSVTFKMINLSDPKGVDEWDKQKDTFAVRHAGRVFSPEDQSTHMITVSADFTEERPFFALTEYIAWADGQIKQSKRWSDLSRVEKNGENFWFPWQGISGDLRVEGNEPQQMRFEFDRGRLLDLLVGHAIYNEPTVAIRELMQNAIDAVRFQNYLSIKDSDETNKPVLPIGKVKVSWDSTTRILIIEDEGTGMDLDIIKFHLMRVGSSFYETPQFTSEFKGFTPISRFGIGVLTCFMISDDIEIVTFKKNIGHRIRMTSVHADYLLRDLQPGDPKLYGIEPHGTRVTLVIREGEKLKNINVENILRYWVVLPACNVEYSETGKPVVRIGYDSAADALKHFYENDAKQSQSNIENIQIISKKRKIGDEVYEIALAVTSSWLPEKAFAKKTYKKCSAVCIEGISVSESLPGFGKMQPEYQYMSWNDNSVGALLSVRGARGLRTTVSRSDLEEDDDYLKVERICADIFFEHIQDEIIRISQEIGKPLSRASTAGKWLCQDLLESSHITPHVKDHISNLRRKLPLIVMELNDEKDGKSAIERKIISLEDLKFEPFFWTIESRLVDSLGIISRDLGRELSLSEFLNALAPDYGELRFSPILPDAHLFSDDISETYIPEKVQFSRKYQQTVIKWIPGAGLIKINEYGRKIFKCDSLMTKASVEVERLKQLENFDSSKIKVAPIGISDLSGDDKNIAVVVTRISIILKRGTEASTIWDTLQKAYSEAILKEDTNLYAIILILQRVFLFYAQQIYYSYEGKRYDSTWNRLVEKANDAFYVAGSKIVLPNKTDFIIPDMIFNASMYWRNWHRDNK